MVDCLKNILGYSGCGSNSFLVDVSTLEGFSFETIDKIKPKDKTTYDYINQLINNAIEECNSTILTKMQPYYNLNQLQEFSGFGKFKENSYFYAVPQFRGLKITKQTQELQKLFVQSVKVKTNNTTVANLLITDGLDVTPIAISLIAGKETELEVNYAAKNDTIYITLDNTNLQVSDGTLYDSLSCKTCKSSSLFLNGCKLDISGWNGTQTDNNCYGITARVSTKCDYNILFCMMKLSTNLPQCYLYKFGDLYTRAAIFSNRLNEQTIYNLERNKALNELYKQEYKEKVKFLITSLDTWLSKIDDNCLVCRGLKYGYSL